ncbi:MAG: murein biosynthesis integral membrane protein MurJ, partial [Nitrospinaceae bacterium]|nr:murein biosynthesis integral membrane protein MurJ [Nitrospinaceae bacterium]NIR56398.1 murein biosynthesis integral membrane protein MurJ [Nitrospinaceae bacterium]NIS86862.1 murein biosynthesis integral membrane protein MurJ [Nitrospinaceae bacterium]NIT83698.1 murein biosynthesis integral membrane protein MurJ [Nitrospinaceae bacterium]NIU45894.1 murein biosynthesis integral membrane protein MurJ [Nitrospinaceae bacterium]
MISPLLEEPILGLAIGVLAGGVLQLLVQLPETLRRGLTFVRTFNQRHPEVVKMVRLMGPVVLGLAVYELN